MIHKELMIKQEKQLKRGKELLARGRELLAKGNQIEKKLDDREADLIEAKREEREIWLKYPSTRESRVVSAAVKDTG